MAGELRFRCYLPQHPNLRSLYRPSSAVEDLERTIDASIDEELDKAAKQVGCELNTTVDSLPIRIFTNLQFRQKRMRTSSAF